MKFALMLTADLSVLTEANSPEELDFDRAYPYDRWHVCVRWSAPDGLSYGVKLVARVNLTGTKDYAADSAYAVKFVRDELVAGNKAGEFDIIDDLVDGPVIDIDFEE